MIHSSYLVNLFDPKIRNVIVKNTIHAIAEYFPKCTIAVSGVSGLAIGWPVATQMQRDIMVIRKDDYCRHSSFDVEGNLDCSEYVIIDDLIDTGNTIDFILQKIKQCYKTRSLSVPKCKGIILYNSEASKFHFQYKKLIIKEVY